MDAPICAGGPALCRELRRDVLSSDMPESLPVQGMQGAGVFQIVSSDNVPFFLRAVKEPFARQKGGLQGERPCARSCSQQSSGVENFQRTRYVCAE